MFLLKYLDPQYPVPLPLLHWLSFIIIPCRSVRQTRAAAWPSTGRLPPASGTPSFTRFSSSPPAFFAQLSKIRWVCHTYTWWLVSRTPCRGVVDTSVDPLWSAISHSCWFLSPKYGLPPGCDFFFALFVYCSLVVFFCLSLYPFPFCPCERVKGIRER